MVDSVIVEDTEVENQIVCVVAAVVAVVAASAAVESDSY